MNFWKLTVVAVAASLCNEAIGAVAADENPKEIAAFAKAPWKVESVVYGDLTGKKTNDAAMILVKGKKDPDMGAADDRKIIIALRGPDKKLHASAESRIAVPDCSYINAMPPDLSISNNSLFMSQGGGANERTNYSWQYKLMDGQWRLIGYTSEIFDAVADTPHDAKTDANLLTGYVESTLSKGQDENTKPIKALKLYEVMSVTGSPAAGGEWQTPYTVLNEKKNIDRRPELWHGANDLSATLRSYHQGYKTLYLQVDVNDDKVTAADTVALVDLKGKKIEPMAQTRTDRPGGYRETLQFDMTKEPFKKAIGQVHPGASTLPFTVEVADADGDAKEQKVLSTAVSAMHAPKQGAILLMPTTSRYTILNTDNRSGVVQPDFLLLPQLEIK